MALSCVMSDINELLVENSIFYTPAFDLPFRNGLRRNIAITFGTEKLICRGYPTVKKV